MNDVRLPNGGTLRIEAVEQRGFRSDGWSVTANYIPPGSTQEESIGGWEGENLNPAIYFVGDLVIIHSPNQKTLHVRTQNGMWKSFYIQFPDDRDTGSIQHFVASTTLSEEELYTPRTDLDPDEKSWIPQTYLKGFDPRTMEVYVLYQTNLETARHIYLKLSSDGTHLSLSKIRKEKQPTKTRAGP